MSKFLLLFLSILGSLDAEVKLLLSNKISEPGVIDAFRIGQDEINGAFYNAGDESVTIVLPRSEAGRELYALQIISGGKKIDIPARVYGQMTGGMGVSHLFDLDPGKACIFTIATTSNEWDLAGREIPTGKVSLCLKYRLGESEVDFHSWPAFKSRLLTPYKRPERVPTVLSVDSTPLSVALRN